MNINYRIITIATVLLMGSGVVWYIRAQSTTEIALFKELRRLVAEYQGVKEEAVFTQLKTAIQDRDVSSNAVDKSNGKSLLMYAARAGSSDMVAYLLDKGADVNYANGVNETALMYGVLSENLPVVMLLVSHGANLNANSYGWTPFKWARDIGNKNSPVAKYLLKMGARLPKYQWGYSKIRYQRSQQ